MGFLLYDTGFAFPSIFETGYQVMAREWMAKESEEGGAPVPGSQSTTKWDFSFTTPDSPFQVFLKLISSDGKGMDGKGIGRRRRPSPWIAKHNKMWFF